MMKLFHCCSGMLFTTGTFFVVALPWSAAQEQRPIQPVAATSVASSVPALKARSFDPTRMNVQQRQLFMSAQRGADWLLRANKPDGRFVYGFLPSLRQPMEGDQYLVQVGASQALGRAANFLGEERSAAIARQALLALLLETTTDPKEPQIRHTVLSSHLLNQPAAAGLLVQAIHELPNPAKDLLDKADQLCNFLQGQIRQDGSLEVETSKTAAEGAADQIMNYSGPALAGLIRSQYLRPASWKTDNLRKARVYYQAWWREHKNLPMVPGHTAAFTEGFALTRDPGMAQFVFEMNDWLCTLQYQNLDPRRQEWTGGFMQWVHGKAIELPPDINSAQAAESLADACRVAQLAGDLSRQKRYQQALESCLQFLTTLQYTEANTQHFADWYRPLLVGGFHGSAQDGNLRLDYTQHSVLALVQYLRHVAEMP